MDDATTTNLDQQADEGGSLDSVDAPPATYGPEGAINYYFPVEVVVTGGLTAQDRDGVQTQIFQNLQEAILRRTT